MREAVADTVPLALARGTQLELMADAPVRIEGERAALTALVRNLADNAVRYSPPGSRVELRVAAAGGSASLQVDDAGPGIPTGDRERVFDRFYRRGQGDEPGTGLGLAIVRGVAQRHGATVALEDSPLGGLRVALRFGAASTPQEPVADAKFSRPVVTTDSLPQAGTVRVFGVGSLGALQLHALVQREPVEAATYLTR